MFSNGDPFTGVDNWMLKQEDTELELPTTQTITPVSAGQMLSPAPQVPQSRNVTADQVARSSLPSNRNSAGHTNESDPPRRSEGYYLAFHAVLPGVYSSS